MGKEVKQIPYKGLYFILFFKNGVQEFQLLLVYWEKKNMFIIVTLLNFL